MRLPHLARLGVCLAGACVVGHAGSETPAAVQRELPRIAVVAGPTATILNTDPPVTSRKARAKYGLPPLHDWFGRPVTTDTLYYQRLAAPVTVYIEQFSAHPLERDAAAAFAPPDGYLDATNQFHPTRQSPADRPVYQVELRPEDGLYPLPYMARRSDGAPWDDFNGPDGAVRQTFFPDASRLFEEIERTGSVLNGNFSGRVQLVHLRAAPSGGFTQGLPPEKIGVDFFPYGYGNAIPPRSALAQITNVVQQALADRKTRGVLWLEGSPRVEDTLYWLNLLIDSEALIVGSAAQRPNHRLAADAAQNLVDAVDFILSDAWRDTDGHNRVGAVLVQDQQVFAAREVVKTAPRPGGYSTMGGHGGVIGSTTGPTLLFLPNRRHGANSAVRLSQLPESVQGVQRDAAGQLSPVVVPVRSAAGLLRETAIPQVEVIDLSDWMTVQQEGKPVVTTAIESLVNRTLGESPLGGIVAESAQGGHFAAVEVAALEQAALRGLPVVKVFRGATGFFVYSSAGNLLIEGSNLNAAKARVLLMACLLRFGSLPLAADPSHPTTAELAVTRARIAEYQAVFDTH